MFLIENERLHISGTRDDPGRDLYLWRIRREGVIPLYDVIYERGLSTSADGDGFWDLDIKVGTEICYLDDGGRAILF